LMVASTPREFPLITANSLSSKTWRLMPKAYVAAQERRVFGHDPIPPDSPAARRRRLSA
jgi:hypothetical protein